MTPCFKKKDKKMHDKAKEVVNDAVKMIVDNPEAGVQKRGDLSGVYVYKFDIQNQEFLLAYEYDEKLRILINIGVHQNFYKNTKRLVN